MPEFASEKAEVIQRHIDDAEEEFDVSRWEGHYVRGLRNWVAHSIVMEKRRIAAGAQAIAGDLTSQTIETVGGGGLGGSRVTKARSADAVARAADNPYYESQYGKEYLRLARLVGMGAFAT